MRRILAAKGKGCFTVLQVTKRQRGTASYNRLRVQPTPQGCRVLPWSLRLRLSRLAAQRRCALPKGNTECWRCRSTPTRTLILWCVSSHCAAAAAACFCTVYSAKAEQPLTCNILGFRAVRVFDTGSGSHAPSHCCFARSNGAPSTLFPRSFRFPSRSEVEDVVCRGRTLTKFKLETRRE